MAYTCKYCRYGYDRSPDGRRAPQGTVWCGKRRIPMGENRSLSCFVPLVTKEAKRCQDCRWMKPRKPTGETVTAGNVWCRRRNIEIGKMRTMECFE